MNYQNFVYDHIEQVWYGPDHDPSDILDYVLDFSTILDTDTIDYVTANASGISITQTTHDSQSVAVWLAGGAANTIATVTIRVVSVGGRTIERSFKVRIRNL